MKVNMSNTDRVIHFLLGGAFVGFGLAFGPVGTVIGIALAVIMWGTAITGVCPLYMLFHIDTRKLGTKSGS
jgi:hypothetical protein